MEDIFESILGYRTLSASKARKLNHLSHTPPEYWTPGERMLSGKARTRWLHEERKRAWRGGSPAILDRIWPVGPYWPNGGTMAGGEAARRQFREEVGRMRYRDQARADAESQYYGVHPHDVLGLAPQHLQHLLQHEGDWTRGEPNQILNDRARARRMREHSHQQQPWRHVGRADLHFSPQELLRNGRFGAMVGAETEEDAYRRYGWEMLQGPFYGPGGDANWDDDLRPRVFEAGNGIGRGGNGYYDEEGGPPFWG